MNVEEYCLKIIPFLLKQYDPKRKGIAIDIGVGTFMFYCEVFKKSKYLTYAIEPIPSNELKEICKTNNINLIEKCIYTYDGQIDIFSGIFNDTELTDVSSVNNDWWGINHNSKKISVACLTLNTFLSKFSIKKISYLKIDTEGCEFEILQQLEQLDKSILPEIIEFEYGGGCTKKENIKGWSPNYFSKTIQSINVLKSLGYSHALVFEREIQEPVELQLNENIEAQFKDFYVYGDIIFFKTKKIEIAEIITVYNTNENPNTLLKRIIRFFK